MKSCQMKNQTDKSRVYSTGFELEINNNTSKMEFVFLQKGYCYYST